MFINAALAALYPPGLLTSLFISLVAICASVNPTFSQRLDEPKLVNLWGGGEDYGETLDNTAAELSNYVKDNPGSKAVARICSGGKMSGALASSVGFPFYFFEAMKRWGIAPEQIYLARSSECLRKSKVVFDEFWFVPKDSNFRYDEIIPAEKVSFRRLYIGYYENEESLLAKKEFAGKTREFIDEMKNDLAAEGFIIVYGRNKFINRNLQKALKQIRSEKLSASRVRVVRKRGFYQHYPEFMTITIKE